METLWKSVERAEEHEQLRRGVPQGGATNEWDDIQERAQWGYNRLAYPTGKTPPA